MKKQVIDCDLLVVGGGSAGLWAAHPSLSETVQVCH